MKKILFLFLMVLIFFNFSYAEELLNKEAIIYYNTGVQAQKDGDFITANTAYQKALLINPAYRNFIANNIGVVYGQEGELEKAEAAFFEALDADPNYKLPLFNLGLIYYIRGDKMEALKYWAKYFNIDELSSRGFLMEERKIEVPQ